MSGFKKFKKNVAYNQIKRQVEEIKCLNAKLREYQDQEQDMKTKLLENRYQLDNKEAIVKESNMVHKLKELEDSHIIAELRQRVASLECTIQELVTTGQLNGDPSDDAEDCKLNRTSSIDVEDDLDDSFCLKHNELKMKLSISSIKSKEVKLNGFDEEKEPIDNPSEQ
jgi:hypothetical protein